jgi:hypothetical protein
LILLGEMAGMLITCHFRVMLLVSSKEQDKYEESSEGRIPKMPIFCGK